MERTEAIEVIRKCWPVNRNGMLSDALETLIPELKESEDERIRKLLIWQVHLNIEDETNDLAQSVYDGIKGHDPDLEESIEDWKKCLAYLEKQREQKPAEWSEEDEEILLSAIEYVQTYPAHRQSVINWLKSLPERFNLQLKPKVECDNETKIQKAYREGKNAGRKEVFDHPEYYGLQLRRMYDYETGKRNPEWSEEDEKMLGDIIRYLEVQKEDRDAPFFDLAISFLKSLRPSWKPSEEQMSALKEAYESYDFCDGERKALESLYQDLQKLL